MLGNSVIQITTGKLVGAVLLPSSVLLVSGVITWRLWRSKQAQLQAETDDLNDEVRQMKEQMADIQAAKNENQSTVTTLSSSSQQESTPKEDPSLEKTGLFEFLIEDNIQLRQQAK